MQVVCLTASTQSFQAVAAALAITGGPSLSPKSIERVSHEVGQELAEIRNCPPSRMSRRLVPPPPSDAPTVVMVSVDGGRIPTRQPNAGPGVHQPNWRETKNATFERLESQPSLEDPHPELPRCFQDVEHVAKVSEAAVVDADAEVLRTKEDGGAEPADLLVPEREASHQGDHGHEEENAAAEAGEAGELRHFFRSNGAQAVRVDESHSARAAQAPRGDHWQPRCLFRTCLSSMKSAAEFGRDMAREAARRRFGEAERKAFVADGLAANWRIWERHFPDYTPILDFVHVIPYLYRASCAAGGGDAMVVSRYLRWARMCWQSRVQEAVAEIRQLLQSHDLEPEGKVQPGPLAPLHVAYRYLTNNADKMNYVSYRKQGLPVTSARMESVVKQINKRVKGTEKFWNDGPKGAETILQLRAAYLCDDQRLTYYLRRRPGYPYVRRPRSAPSTLKS